MLRKLIGAPILHSINKSLILPGTQNILYSRNILNYGTAVTTITFNSNFSPNEEERILNTINKLNNEELGRYNISQSRIKKIQNWKNKMGPFKTLHELLEIDSFSVKVLKQICNNILDTENVDKKEVKYKPKKTLKQLIIPGIDSNSFQDLKYITGIYLSPNGMSCAQICRDGNTLTHWNMDHFQELPKKMSLIDTYKLAINLVRRIPPSDIYVFESIASLSPSGQQQSLLVSSHNQQQDLTAILLALLNSSISHNVSLQSQEPDQLQDVIENKVYFVKSRLPARLFSLLIGNEKVSAIDIASQLLKSSTVQNDLPCSPIRTDISIKNSFEAHATPNKELLGQALLLVVTFMDLFVYNNSNSWNALSPRNKKNR